MNSVNSSEDTLKKHLLGTLSSRDIARDRWVEEKQPEFAHYLRTCAEVMLFYAIRSLDGLIDGNVCICIPTLRGKQLMEPPQKLYEYAVDRTVRFGVTAPRAETGEASEQYWKWYRWWDAWEKTLTDEEFHVLNDLAENGGNLDRWRPAGDWRA